MCKLMWCPDCKESAVVSKVYRCEKDGKKRTVLYCINEGCRYRRYTETVWVENIDEKS